jgi:hypothetical protein
MIRGNAGAKRRQRLASAVRPRSPAEIETEPALAGDTLNTTRRCSAPPRLSFFASEFRAAAAARYFRGGTRIHAGEYVRKTPWDLAPVDSCFIVPR